MLIAEEQYPSIEIHQLVRNLIDLAETGRSRLLGDHILLDVNEREVYDKEHIIGAQHYDRMFLCRIHYETEVLKRAKALQMTLVVYGYQAGNVVATFFERGFKTLLLRGDIKTFKKFYPRGLLSTTAEKFDISELSVRYTQLKETRWGKGRILHYTRSSRSQSVDRDAVAQRNRPTCEKRPWK